MECDLAYGSIAQLGEWISSVSVTDVISSGYDNITGVLYSPINDRLSSNHTRSRRR